MSLLERHEHKRPAHNFDGIVENRDQTPPRIFTLLFFGLIIWGVLFCAYFLFSGWSSEADYKAEMARFREQVAARGPEQEARTPAVASAPSDGEERDLAAGSELFAAHCAACHGPGGGGGIGPDLTGGTFSYGRTEEDVTASIREGRPGGMPAFGNQLSAGEIDRLADFVLSLGR